MRLRAGTLLTYALPAILFAALTAGQLVRFEPFPGTNGALTALDGALAVLAAVLAVKTIATRRVRDFARATWKHPVWKWSLLFLGWAVLTLAINLPSYSANQGILAAAYLLRLSFAFVVAWLISYLATRPEKQAYLGAFAVSAGALVVLGFLQFIFINDFRFMVVNGWDPHIGRLLSTFYDPNYFGIFLVLVMGFALARSFEAQQTKPARPAVRRWWLGLFALSWIALFLAYSRSAWLAGILAITGLAWRYRRKYAIALLAVFLVALLIPNRLAQRFADSQGLVQTENYSAKLDDYQCADVTICDPSGSARVVTIRQATRLIQTSPLIGVGYNAYAPALKNRDLLRQNQLQSRGSQGSDSSLLNVWATTGIIGLLLFVRFLLAAGAALRRRFTAGGRDGWVAYALLWFTVGWVAVAVFNNALLYLSLLAPWLVLLAVLLPGGAPDGANRAATPARTSPRPRR